jgi:hypothetical protein
MALIYRLNRPHNGPGQDGQLGVGRTNLLEEFILRDESDPP